TRQSRRHAVRKSRARQPRRSSQRLHRQARRPETGGGDRRARSAAVLRRAPALAVRTSDFRLQTSHFLWMLVAEAVLIAAVVTVALDSYAHQRVQSVGGLNVWGYRGPVAHARAANEIRIAIVGGTRAFNWGQHGSGLTTELQRQIMLTTDRPGSPLRPIVAVNLGRLG